MDIHLTPVATVSNSRKSSTDDFRGRVISEIQMADHMKDYWK